MKISSVIIFRKLHVRGMALFPFILLREERLRHNAVIMNHERIHHRQQLELLIIPFYVFYLLNYVMNRWRYGNHHEAYVNIIFEREAYLNDHNLRYLEERKWFAFLKFFRRGDRAV